MRNIWIYALENSLTNVQSVAIIEGLNQYLANWQSHGTPVPGTAEIKYDRFLIVRAQPGSTSGCSIDDMNRNVNTVLSNAGTSYLEPHEVFFRDANRTITTIDYRNIETAISNGTMNAQTIVFDNSLNDAKDFERWEIPMESTWMSRYLPVVK